MGTAVVAHGDAAPILDAMALAVECLIVGNRDLPAAGRGELILAERGITVTHESIRGWCRKFGPEFAAKLRRRRPKPSDIWHLDEVLLRINGVLHYFR
ncbi:Transposase [Roseomonas mucosa]|uniref:Transposase n=1 Tax=Roseomonas mucosa TaxID=207340 RepID=A0A1S8CZY5_9PROT|nr:Transposase [Roseomonas mucosa]MBS5903959.1 IS6 family transposase [Acetobacteraceae bacterium]GAV34612.1 hypothetical protein ROTAS13_02281 [Roseomonas sp. TAS13]ONH81501.1 hypothetical protein APZ41_019530 [Roseomonas mucosa]QDD94206.1 Transposase [Roseomonas mucosa]